MFTNAVSSLPLVFFRIAFGILMLISTVRFWANGWVQEFYIAPSYHFTYWGFGWLQPLAGAWMYLPFGLMVLCCLLIVVGWYTRGALLGFFLCFSYVELLDKSFYLNHYYFISLLSFLLLFLPLNVRFSLDVHYKRVARQDTVPFWTLPLPRLQLALVYIFAGVAKLEPDWLLHAQPLTIWLRMHAEKPLVGALFAQPWAAYAMSWAGMLYDLSIVFLLLWKPTRWLGYVAVAAFHLLTAWLFPIGMFPWIMMTASLIFLPAVYCERLGAFLGLKTAQSFENNVEKSPKSYHLPTIATLTLVCFFAFQIAMPLRHHLYGGNILWHENGYRFSWRVMLAEKTGEVFYTVHDSETGRSYLRHPSRDLTPQQAKQMAFQPDMLLQYAHHLGEEARAHGWQHPQVFADSWVSLNGRSSQPFIKPDVDLLQIPYDLRARDSWVLPSPD